MLMNNFSQKFSKFLTILGFVLYAAWLLLPSFQVATGAITGIAFMILCGIAILLDKPFFRNHSKDLMWLLASALFLTAQLCIVYTVGLTRFLILFPQVFMIFFPFIVVYYLKEQLHRQEIIVLLLLILIFTLITSVINIYWLHNNAFTVRALGYGEAEENYLRRAMSYGIGGFGFNYGLLFFIASICYAIHLLHNKFIKFLLITIVLFAGYALFLSRYLIAFVLLLISLGIFLLHTILSRFQKKNNPKIGKQIFLIFICILLLFLVFQQSVFEGLIQFLLEKNYEDYAQKLQAVQVALQDNNLENTNLGRISDYYKAIDTIIKSPIIGIRIDNHHEISGHSSILDIIADSGIPIALLFLSILIFFIKKSICSIRISREPYFQYAYFILFLLSLLNVIIHIREAFLFLAILPLIHSLDTQEQIDRNAKK